MERVLGNKVFFSNLVIYSLSVLTSCQFTNEPNREISRGVFQNRGVCGQAFPLLPTSYPFHFFCSRSNFRAVTRLETLATQATEVWVISASRMIKRFVVFIVTVIMCRHSPLHHNTEVFAGFTNVRSLAVAAFDLVHYSSLSSGLSFSLTLVSSRRKKVIDRFMCNTYVVRL